MIHWLTTAPNPRVRPYGPDQGQRGWQLHAIEAEKDATMSGVKYKRSLCGLLPRHGWGLDLIIEDECERCVRALEKQK